MEKKTLIIAEKPSAATAIASALGGFTRGNGFLENSEYFLTWGIGHLVELCEPEDYDPRYKKWKLVDLPIVPQFRLKPTFKTRSQLVIIQNLAKKSKALINACDSAREGELIFGGIVEYLKLSKLPVKRLWTASLTEDAILQAFSKLRPGSDFYPLFLSAKCRSEGDWLIGINGTRAFTAQFGDLYSLGRVQTPVLALLYENFQKRNQFVSEPFWEVQANFRFGKSTTYIGKWFTFEGTHLSTLQKANQIALDISEKPAVIESYAISQRRENPPKLFDLTTLQRTCNAKYGFSAQKTLSTAQSLYEKHKAITYPRTNSQYVTEEEIKQMLQVLNILSKHPHYEILTRSADPKRVTIQNNALCRPSAIEDHHAILPTGKIPKSLTADEAKVFDEVVRRMLSHFYPPALFEKTEIVTRVVEHTFRTTNEHLMTPGWHLVAPLERKEPKRHSEAVTRLQLQKGEVGFCESSEILESQTEPPKLFTEGTLLSAMETCGKKLQDEELREAIKECGLGTPATRASILERLKQVGYMETKGKSIEITPKGIRLIGLLQGVDIPLLLSPEMTGNWEKYLAQIARGEGSPEVFMKRIGELTHHLVDRVQLAPRQKRKNADKPVLGSCPICKGEVKAEYKGFSCSNRKTGCTFMIWKSIRNKTLTEKQVVDLLVRGKTGPLSFRTKEGKPYRARFVLNQVSGEITTDLVTKKPQ